MKIRTLIADDMPLSRARTRRFLEDEADIEIIGECADGEAVLAAIGSERPDLVFLDVQMPGMSGIELLERVPPEQRPAVVFITAFDEFAVPAFEVRAVDYLLKPFDRERLQQALARVRERLAVAPPGSGERKPLSRFAVKSAGKTVFVNVDDVDWIETAGNYLCLHAGSTTHLVRETMAQVEAQIDPQKFARIHRSAIVRLDRIKEMQPLFNGDRAVILHDGTRLTLSRSYRDQVIDRLGAI